MKENEKETRGGSLVTIKKWRGKKMKRAFYLLYRGGSEMKIT